MKLDLKEIADWKLSDQHLEDAIRELRVTGYVIFEGVLASPRVHELHSAFMEIFERYVAEIGDNRGKQRQGGVPLPIEGTFADPDLMGNPMVIDLLERLLGPELVCSYFASDTPMPGSEYQPVHRDGKDLFPGVPVTVPPYMYELNVPLVDFRDDNGPLEVTTETGRPVSILASEFRDTGVQNFASGLPGQRVLMPAGSFLVRDPRMWHRGTPNRSSAARPMLSLAYGRSWYRFNAVTLQREVYDAWPARVRELFRLASIDGVLSREFA
jgi:hypothetical protein